jgi:flagellar biosynthesis/type III secretory pathway protein FliH
MAENPMILKARPAGTRRLYAVQPATAPAELPELGPITPPAGGEARTLSGLNGFLENARRQGAELVAVAREQAEMIAANAREQGFAAGYEAGMRQAEASAADMLAHAEHTAREVVRFRDETMAGAERELVELSLQLAEKILQRTFEAEPERVVDVLRGALRKTFSRDGLTVVCNPDDLQRLQSAGPELAGTLGGLDDLRFVTDRRIERGGVVVRTPSGDVDATIDAQLDRLTMLLLEREQHG